MDVLWHLDIDRHDDWFFGKVRYTDHGEFLIDALDGLSGLIKKRNKGNFSCFRVALGICMPASATGFGFGGPYGPDPVWLIRFDPVWSFDSVAEELDQRVSEIFALRERVSSFMRVYAFVDPKPPLPEWFQALLHP